MYNFWCLTLGNNLKDNGEHELTICPRISFYKTHF